MESNHIYKVFHHFLACRAANKSRVLVGGSVDVLEVAFCSVLTFPSPFPSLSPSAFRPCYNHSVSTSKFPMAQNFELVSSSSVFQDLMYMELDDFATLFPYHTRLNTSQVLHTSANSRSFSNAHRTSLYRENIYKLSIIFSISRFITFTKFT